MRVQGALHASLRPALPLVLAAVSLAGCADTFQQEPAELVLRNGRIVTVDEDIGEVQALAVRGDRIVAAGTDVEIDGYVGEETEVIDLEGMLAVPGFIESHAHFTGIGNAQLQLQLMATRTWEEIVGMVEEAVARAEPGELIRGRGWHQEKWDTPPAEHVDGIPVHTSLSAVSPDNPVILTHASGHATYANARAMELAGITAGTQDPEGGQIVRDAQGNAVGMFRETASDLLDPVFEGAPSPDPKRVIRLADEEVLSKGITSLHDAGSPFSTVDVYREVVEAGDLGVRLYVMIRDSNEALAGNLAAYRTVGAGNDHLTVRSIKRTIDGALGSHGAWLLEPYSDMPSSSGLNTAPVESVEETARLAAENDYQLAVHAIGDRANREVLDLFQETFAEYPEKEDWRWRIEHAQHLHPDDIPRFAELGVIASMQGVHATSDAPYVPVRLGAERSEEGAYVWQDLIQSGAVVTNGTDAPVEDVDPVASYYSSVSRRTASDDVFYPEQRMSRMEALRSYTINGAFAAFEEDLKGTLTPGKLADITVLSKDILTIPEEEIPTAEVVYTIVGGDVKYRRDAAAGAGAGR